MLALKNRNIVPAGGFRYTQRESGVTMAAHTFNQLCELVKNHRQANGYPLSIDYEAEIEMQLCLQLDREECKQVKAEIKPRQLGFADVMRFTKTLGESVLKGNPRVDKEEANRRALICTGCNANVKAMGCSGCNSKRVASLITTLTGTDKTDHDEKLDSCAYCGCFNKAQVWFPLDILQNNVKESINNALPEHCWKKKNNDGA